MVENQPVAPLEPRTSTDCGATHDWREQFVEHRGDHPRQQHELIKPPKSTSASGECGLECSRTSGTSPPIAVNVVSKIGTRRASPADRSHLAPAAADSGNALDSV
jgi:hypothetical protein